MAYKYKEPIKRKKKHDPHHSVVLKKAAKKSPAVPVNVVIEMEDNTTTPAMRFSCSGSSVLPSEVNKELTLRPHYYGGKHNVYEIVKVIKALDLNFNLGNVLKYMARAGKKDDIIKELEKAKTYLEIEIDYLKNQDQ